MTKKLPLELKQNRKPIHTACGFCHEKHLQCDIGRPCQNCIKRNISSLCRDKVRKRRRKPDIEGYEEAASRTQNFNGVNSGEGPSSTVVSKDEKNVTSADSGDENFSRAMEEAAENILGANPLLSEREASEIDDSGWGFDSIWTSDEYLKLNDLTSLAPEVIPLELSPSERPGSNEDSLSNFGSALHKTNSRPYISLNMAQNNSISSVPCFTKCGDSNEEEQPPQEQQSKLIRLQSQQQVPQERQQKQQEQQQHRTQQVTRQQRLGNKVESELELTPFKLRQLIRTPKDLFDKKNLVKPHNYREAYKDLLQCLQKMFLGSYYRRKNGKWELITDDEDQMHKLFTRKEQLQHIAKSISELYMPTFVALTSNMIEEDLLLQEIVVQRSLLELENMSRLVNCTPICIWRRSGEICFVSNEFCSLTGFCKREILDQKSFIVEFLDHQSVVNYYDLFHEHLAFGPQKSAKEFSDNNQAVYSECNLLLNNGSFLKCACCLSAKRDAFNISLLIVGQFLPIFDVQ